MLFNAMDDEENTYELHVETEIYLYDLPSRKITLSRARDTS